MKKCSFKVSGLAEKWLRYGERERRTRRVFCRNTNRRWLQKVAQQNPDQRCELLLSLLAESGQPSDCAAQHNGFSRSCHQKSGTDAACSAFEVAIAEIHLQTAGAVVETENNAHRLLETVPKATDLVRIVAEIVLARRYLQIALLEELHANRYHVTKT